MIRATLTAAVIALTITATASAQWTPAKPGDPRTCGTGYTTRACLSGAALNAFKAKYQRVTGTTFVGSFRCTQTGPLALSCAWATPAVTQRIVVVRFAHKAAGWKAAVGAIATG